MAQADYDFGAQEDDPDAEGWGTGVVDPEGNGPVAVSRLRRMVNLAGALSSIALVIGAGVWGYKLAVRDVQGVPVILALDEPMRVAPDDPGGEIVDYQGLAVNDVAEVGVATPLPDRLVLAPRPVELSPEDMAGLAGADVDPDLSAIPAAAVTGGETPVLAAEPLGESASPTEIAIDAALAEALGEAPVDEAPVDVAEEAAGAEVLDPPLVDLAMEALPEGAITLSPRPKARPGSAGAETVAAQPAALATEAVEVDPATIPVGTRLVQFGAFDTKDEARAEWARLESQFGEVMAGKGLVLQPAESGGRTFFRLRAHGFEDEDDARRFCAAFAANGAICIPVPQR